jgi:hypothetical protein
MPAVAIARPFVQTMYACERFEVANLCELLVGEVVHYLAGMRPPTKCYPNWMSAHTAREIPARV